MVILPAGKAVLFTATPVDSAFHPASWGETFLRWKALHEQGYFRGSHQYTLRNEWYKRGEGRLLFSLPLRLRDYNLCWHCTGWVLKSRVLSYLPPPPARCISPRPRLSLLIPPTRTRVEGRSQLCECTCARARTHLEGVEGVLLALRKIFLSQSPSVSSLPPLVSFLCARLVRSGMRWEQPAESFASRGNWSIVPLPCWPLSAAASR